MGVVTTSFSFMPEQPEKLTYSSGSAQVRELGDPARGIYRRVTARRAARLDRLV